MAIEEAKKSENERDRRIHPKVGVVVVQNGKVLACAHRGEIQLGDHAEYTVLERKLSSTNLTGATLYTTLEPCTERSKNKTPCADRVAERKIARVVIGTYDPNPAVYGGSLLKLMKAGIDVSFIRSTNPDLEKEILELNKAFLDQQFDVAPPESDLVRMQHILRWSGTVLSPAALFPVIATISIALCSLFIYPLMAQSVASYWFQLSQWLVLLLGFVLVPAGLLYVVTSARVSTSTDTPGISSQSIFAAARKKFLIDRRFVKGILLLLLLAVMFTTTDAKFGLFSPRIDHIVTQYTPGYSVAGSVSNFRVLVHVARTYFIDSPFIWLIGTIDLPNPSNYSYSPPTTPCNYVNYGYYSGPPLFCGVITASSPDSRAQLSPQINASASIQSFQVILSPSQSYAVAVSMSYDDYVSGRPIVAVYGTPLANGQISYQFINLTISNPFTEQLSVGQLQIGRYGSIVNVSCTKNGVAYGVGCTSNSTTTLWLWQQYLSPGQTTSLALNVTFSGPAYS